MQESEKLKGMKWLLAMLSKGNTIAEFFPDVHFPQFQGSKMQAHFLYFRLHYHLTAQADHVFDQQFHPLPVGSTFHCRQYSVGIALLPLIVYSGKRRLGLPAREYFLKMVLFNICYKNQRSNGVKLGEADHSASPILYLYCYLAFLYSLLRRIILCAGSYLVSSSSVLNSATIAS